MTQRGRKSKLTKELIQEAANIIKMGIYVETACDYLGIHRSTWYKWLSEGEKAKGGLKKEFFDTIKKAEAEAQIRNIGIIQQAAKDNWQAAAWYLERRYPERWGRRKVIEVSDQEKEKKVDFVDLLAAAWELVSDDSG
jgi:hypothetical protein